MISVKKLKVDQKTADFKNAEVKILLIFFYYIVAGVTGLAALTIFLINVNEVSEAVSEFFMCEAPGNPDCQLNVMVPARDLPSAAIIMLSLLPTVILLFSLNVKLVKEKIKSAMMKCHS